jgi:hypothetical protein
MTKFPRLLRDICALAVAATSFGAGVDIADWKHLQEVTIRNPGVVRVPLPAATLDAATEDYRDLRLLDPAGQEQSFLLEGTQSFPPEQRPVARFDSRIASDATELTIAIGTNAPLDSIELDSPHRNFIKAARVEISSDGENWEGIATGLPLFRQSGSEQLTLSLGGRRAPHVRVTVDDARSDPIPFTRAVARLSRTTGAADLPLEATVVRDSFAAEPGNLHGCLHPPGFRRRARAPGRRGRGAHPRHRHALSHPGRGDGDARAARSSTASQGPEPRVAGSHS